MRRREAVDARLGCALPQRSSGVADRGLRQQTSRLCRPRRSRRPGRRPNGVEIAAVRKSPELPPGRWAARNGPRRCGRSRVDLPLKLDSRRHDGRRRRPATTASGRVMQCRSGRQPPGPDESAQLFGGNLSYPREQASGSHEILSADARRRQGRAIRRLESGGVEPPGRPSNRPLGTVPDPKTREPRPTDPGLGGGGAVVAGAVGQTSPRRRPSPSHGPSQVGASPGSPSGVKGPSSRRLVHASSVSESGGAAGSECPFT